MKIYLAIVTAACLGLVAGNQLGYKSGATDVASLAYEKGYGDGVEDAYDLGLEAGLMTCIYEEKT